MGYNSDFDGQLAVDPPLNDAEIAYLQAFTATWHDQSDPYYVANPDADDRAPVLATEPMSLSPLRPPNEHCAWIPTFDGSGIEWNGDEKFYDAAEWMQYLIDHFLTGSVGSFATDPRSAGFTFNHTCHGHIRAQGESFDDRWALAVSGNQVEVHALY